MIIDGHFHLHYTIPTKNESIIKAMKKRVKKIKENHSLERILGVIPTENSKIVDIIRKEHSYISPGIYILVENYNSNLLEKIKKFDFIKINNWLGSPFLLPEKLEELFLDSISNKIKKFQIHTSKLDEERLGLIKKYIQEYDAFFYLTHGVYASYHYSSKTNLNELKRLEGNLLLGTSPFWGTIAEIPNESLIKAIKDGLENLIVFESDFVLNYNEEFYRYTIESVRESVKNDKTLEKILYENIKIFL